MKYIHLYLFLLILMTWTKGFSQNTNPILLYPNGVPNAKQTPANYAEKTVTEDVVKVSMVTEPTITPFFPERGKANGTAVLICPGGAYRFLAIQHEGYDVAKKLNELGITAFVLKYRLPSDAIMPDKTIGPLQDAQRGIQIIRERAAEWNIDTAKIGIMGFSAGGHLASTAGTHYNKAVIDNKGNINLRPNFMLLLYPVITFGELTHQGSKTNLIGKDAPQTTVNLYSNEKQVNADTPPTFLVQSENDSTVKVQNSLMFYSALLKAGVKAEMHLYQAGGHGYGLNNRSTKDYWFDRCANWLRENGFLK